MITRTILVGITLALSWLPAAEATDVTILAGKLSLQLDPRNGTVRTISVAGREVPVRKGRPLLEIRDIKAGAAFLPVYGEPHRSGDGWNLESKIAEAGLGVRVRLEPRDEILFCGVTLINTRADDRGFVVAMTVEVTDADVRWAGPLNNEIRPEKHRIYGDNLYPVTALRSEVGSWGLAAAIPPTHPVFYDTHYRDGEFGIQYYVATTPATRQFANRAEIAGMLYSANPRWALRSALETYYHAFPDFYRRRVNRAGLWCYYMDPALMKRAEDCTFYEVGGGEWKIQETTARSKDDWGLGESTARSLADWATKNWIDNAVKGSAYILPYTIVGQRQIYALPGETLINDYERAMKTLKEWTIGKVIPFQGPPQANSFRSVAELKEIIENSGLYDRSGRFQFVPRFYTGNTLTFPLNPNPNLFADSSKMTIARYTLEFYIPELANGLPSVGGFYVDSMGLWGNFLNYRRDHFTYARHTLGTDAVGNPVLPNVLSHYEYLSELGQRLHARGKVLFANGIHEGSAKTNRDGRSDHDASRNTSRFFLAAVSDIGGSEAAAQMQRMELLRIMMGPKPYSTIDEKPMDATALIRYSKRGTAMGIFTSLGPSYYKREEWRARTRPLHDFYLQLQRLLDEAGWEPVRGVFGADGLASERFGKPGAGRVFLTLFNESETPRILTLKLDPQIFPSGLRVASDLASGGEAFHFVSGAVSVKVQPGQLRVLELQ